MQWLTLKSKFRAVDHSGEEYLGQLEVKFDMALQDDFGFIMVYSWKNPEFENLVLLSL
jgi:hypothetical protein